MLRIYKQSKKVHKAGLFHILFGLITLLIFISGMVRLYETLLWEQPVCLFGAEKILAEIRSKLTE